LAHGPLHWSWSVSWRRHDHLSGDVEFVEDVKHILFAIVVVREAALALWLGATAQVVELATSAVLLRGDWMRSAAALRQSAYAFEPFVTDCFRYEVLLPILVVAVAVAGLGWLQQSAHGILMLLLLLAQLLVILVELCRRYVVLRLLGKWIAVRIHSILLGVRHLSVGVEAARFRLSW